MHLGEDFVLRTRDVIAILEWHPAEEIYEYIERFKEEDKLVDISDNDTKSIVVTESYLYLSPLSSLTLKRRALDETETEDDITLDENGTKNSLTLERTKPEM